jgi:hypothetical protein
MCERKRKKANAEMQRSRMSHDYRFIIVSTRKVLLRRKKSRTEERCVYACEPSIINRKIKIKKEHGKRAVHFGS